jgi:TetR/AcrR family transcriptional regulator, transcriptional repressor for nem operon
VDVRQSLRRLDDMLQARPDQPVRVLWEFSADETDATLTMEFGALGNHRETVRREIADHTNRLRALQLEALAEADAEGIPPAALLFLLSGVPKLIRMEERFDVDIGHGEVVALVERHLEGS